MKKILFMVMVVLSFGLMGCIDPKPTASQVTAMEQDRSAEQAMSSVVIPRVTYFQERRTIAKWAVRWDQPSLPCYVYLFSYGNCIGYYVTDGKPASTRSYLFPEEEKVFGYELTLPTADIDGTYGENNPGIRFFTAEGVAVEWGGSGASYLYSDAPLSLNVPLLHK